MKAFINKLTPRDVIFIGIIVFKISFFYVLTDISKESFLINMITFSIIAIAFYSFLYDQRSSSWKRFMIIYCAISALMFVDAAYYSYYNEFLSVNQLFQISKFPAIKKSIMRLDIPICLLLIIDIPYVMWYCRNLKRTISEVPRWHIRYKKIAVFSLAAMFITMVVNPFNADTVKAINHNEVITYHLYDVYTNLFGEKDNIIESEEDVRKVIRDSKNYFMSKNYNGIGKDKNLIVVQMESLSNFTLNTFYEGQELTPNLNQLIKDRTIYFENYYQSIGKGNTSDAEFSSLNSLYPNIEGSSYERYTNNTFYGLPWVMRENGYSATAYHGYIGEFWSREETYPYQGFEDFKSAEDFHITTDIGYGMSDEEMFTQTIEYMKDLEKPFFSFIVTLSNHHPYELPEQYAEIELSKEDEGTIFGNYMQSVYYADKSLGLFLEILKENDLYEDSILVFYGDHHGLNSRSDANRKRMTEFLGYPYDYDKMLNVPLLIHIPGAESNEVKTITGGQIDFLPTIANIMGVELNNPYIMGRDLLNARDGYAASVTYLQRGSFIKNGIMFEYSENGIYDESRAWDIETLQSIPIEGYQRDSERARNLLDASKYILDNDLITRP